MGYPEAYNSSAMPETELEAEARKLCWGHHGLLIAIGGVKVQSFASNHDHNPTHTMDKLEDIPDITRVRARPA